MAYVSELFDQLRDLLGDAGDTQVPFATKKLYLNRGIARLWPRVFRVSSDTSITIAESTWDYALPVAVASGYIISVECETAPDSGRFLRYDAYDVVDGDEDIAGVLRITGVLPTAGTDLRIRYAARVPLITAASYAAAQAEVWTGPDAAMNLPSLYAMGMIAARKLDDRQDTYTYNTQVATNGVSDNDLMASSGMWFAQFESELLDIERPLPIARD